MSEKKPLFRLEHWQVIALLLMVYDAIMVNMSYFCALLLRFDGAFSKIEPQYIDAWERFIPWYTVFCLIVFWFLHLYRSLWRFASYSELTKVVESSVITALFQVIVITKFFCRMPISYYVFGTLIQFAMILGIRFSYRFALLIRSKYSEHDTAARVMLVGAGAAGQMILRDMNNAQEVGDRIVCIIDDNSNKWNRYIDGIPIVGGRNDIIANVEKYHIDKIFIAVPSATAQQRREIIDICKETDCELKNLPGMYQFVTENITVSSMAEVSVEDLLGREPVKTDLTEVFEYINNKVVLVTGGGGSIGSELCRQIASHSPKQLIIFDVYENNAYDIQLELREKYPQLNLVTLIGSVRDSRRMYDVFSTYHPNIVYHAAAHKHVLLMEDSPAEAIKNNVFGTYKTAYAAMACGCDRFVLISTDKAVNPTNVMGASKRMCEMIVQSFDAKIKEHKAEQIPLLFTHKGDIPIEKDTLKNAHTEFVAVRFGNVLGSNGSVIPIFKKQIEHGGPVTVTHPDIIRYFMTIPEAVSLVLLAGTYAKGGEIFVLDMGSPVKIDTLARNLIRLSGYKPDVDIKIEYIGLRPGEKLYEEKLMAEEGLRTTENEKIHIGMPIEFDIDTFLHQLEGFMADAYNNDHNIRRQIAEMVSTYHPADIVNQTFEKKLEETV